MTFKILGGSILRVPNIKYFKRVLIWKSAEHILGPVKVSQVGHPKIEALKIISHFGKYGLKDYGNLGVHMNKKQSEKWFWKFLLLLKFLLITEIRGYSLILIRKNEFAIYGAQK